MITIAKSGYHALSTKIPVDISIVCLWAVFGLAMTVLIVGADVGSIMAVAS
jgi:hypothetical protein